MEAPAYPLAVSASVAAAANNQTLPAAADEYTFLAGFQITGGGATAASVIAVTVTGVQGGTLNYAIPVPAGATLGISPLVVNFDPPLRSSAKNTAIVVNVPSFGAGNTNSSAVAYGFQSSLPRLY